MTPFGNIHSFVKATVKVIIQLAKIVQTSNRTFLTKTSDKTSAILTFNIAAEDDLGTMAHNYLYTTIDKVK